MGKTVFISHKRHSKSDAISIPMAHMLILSLSLGAVSISMCPFAAVFVPAFESFACNHGNASERCPLGTI